MKRIDTSTKSVDLFGAGKHGYKDGDKASGITPTQLNASSLNAIQEEIASVIEAAGIALDGEVYDQLAKAIQSGKLMTAENTGTANALVGVFTPAATALTDGMTLFVRPAAANTSATPTFTPANGVIAAKTIVKGNGLALVAGDIAGAGHWLELKYDLTLDKWELQNPATPIQPMRSIFETVSVGRTLTANDLGKSLIGASATPFTLILPLLSATKAGQRIQFTNMNVGAMTVQRQGSDVINVPTSLTSFVLQTGDRMTLEADASGSYWYVVSISPTAGQTWQDVTASRLAATTYTNSTGQPIIVAANIVSSTSTAGSISITFSVNGAAQPAAMGYSAGVGYKLKDSITVPTGSTYSLAIAGSVGATLSSWFELRQ